MSSGARRCLRLPVITRDWWQPRVPIVLAVTLAIVETVAARGAASAVATERRGRAPHASEVTDPGGTTPCESLDPKQCLFPFPNDSFTVRDVCHHQACTIQHHG